MKKLSVIILIICSLLCIAGCADESEDTNSLVVPTRESVTTVPVAETTAPVFEENKDFSFGQYIENTYINETLNIRLTIPEGWQTKNTAELAKMNGISEDELNYNFSEHIKYKQVAYLLHAIDTNAEGNNVNLIVENLAVSGNSNITSEQYFTLANAQTVAALENIGAKNIVISPTTVNIDENVFCAQVLEYSVQGQDITQMQIAFPVEDYLGLMTITGNYNIILEGLFTI